MNGSIDRGDRPRSRFASCPQVEDEIGYPDLRILVIPRMDPVLQVDGPGGELDHWGAAFADVYEQLGRNVMAPKGLFDDAWIRPGPIWRGTWLWDNAFHSKIWAATNLDFARHVLESHMKFQDLANPDDPLTYGRVPHSIETGGVNGWTQPPLMAWAFWELFKKNGSVDMLQRHFSNLFAYHLWLNENRDLNRDGLYSWVHGFESGLDNAPRFDGISPLECDAVDFSACVSVQLRSLIHLATVLKDDATRDGLESRKAELDAWINEDLWDPARTFYFDKAFEGDHKGEFVGPKSIAGWYPLYAGIVPKDRLPAYLAHLTDETEFWTPFPVPTVARDEPSFDLAMNMWRGPTWINTNYMIIKGLEGYGFRQLPGELAFKTVSHVFDVHRDKGIFFEYYSSLGDNAGIEQFARKGEKNGPRPFFTGWTGLVTTILLEDMLGIEPQHDAILLAPSVPAAFVKGLHGGQVSGRLPLVAGWDQRTIEFTISFNAGDIIEYEFTLSDPMDVHVLDFATRERIYAGDQVGRIQLEVKNHHDTVSILSEPDDASISEQYETRP